MAQIPRTLAVTAPKSGVVSRNTSLETRRVPTKAQQRRERKLRELVKMRYIDRKTIEECAEALETSVRTIYNWLNDAYFAALVETMKNEWTEQGRVEIKSQIQRAVQTLVDLTSPTVRSEHVRFEAAAKLADLAGLLDSQAQEAGDQTSEATRLAQLLEEKLARPDVTIYASLVQPGGYLQGAGMSEAGEQLLRYAAQAAEGSVREEIDHPAWKVVEAD